MLFRSPSTDRIPGDHRRSLSLCLVTVLGAGALTACGSDADEDPPEAAATAAVSTDVPDDETPDSGFTERVHYPVSDGPADPEQNWADLYLPDDAEDSESIPLVVLVRGGAWNHRSNGADDVRDIAHSLTDRGLAVYNVEYRDVDSGNGGWPETYTDAADAMDTVPEVHERHPEISIENSTVVGHSSGAQLAIWSATRDNLETDEEGADPEFVPQHVVTLAGPLDLEWDAETADDNTIEVLGGTPDEKPELYASIDPIQNIDPDIPVVAVHGEDDSLVDPENSERFVARAKRDGADAELVLLDGENHVSFLKEKSAAFAQVVDIIERVATGSS